MSSKIRANGSGGVGRGGLRWGLGFETWLRPGRTHSGEAKTSYRIYVGFSSGRQFNGQMQLKTDAELLREYADEGSEAAFSEIVRRYADFVYSAALRQVSESELARDVAQGVFVSLARKAGSLHPETILIGWLCRGARLAALEQLRKQHRRQHRERQAMELADSSPELPNDWRAVRPVLDEAIAGLGDDDRNALLLRFFKNESLASVGVTLGVSEDAAQKRVSRALEKVREILVARGIHTTGAALSVALTANGVQSAPAGFAGSMATAALAKVAAEGAGFPLLKLLTSTHMKTTILSLILASGVAGLTVQQIKTQGLLHEAQATIQRQNQDLEGLKAAQENQVAQNDELERLRAEAREAVRLRSEVARLRLQVSTAQAPVAGQAKLATSENTTNSQPAMIGLSAKFVTLPTEALKLLNLPAQTGADGTASLVLAKEQFKTMEQALKGASDAVVLGAPRVITSPGVEAQMFVGSRAAHTQPNGETAGGSTSAGPESADTVPGVPATANPGINFKVVPNLSEGSSGYELQVTASFSQWVDRSPQQDGSQKEVQTTQEKVDLAVAEGQTVMMVKAMPNAGWTEGDNTVPGPKSLAVFITPSRPQFATRLAHIIQRSGTNPQPTGAEN